MIQDLCIFIKIKTIFPCSSEISHANNFNWETSSFLKFLFPRSSESKTILKVKLFLNHPPTRYPNMSNH